MRLLDNITHKRSDTLINSARRTVSIDQLFSQVSPVRAYLLLILVSCSYLIFSWFDWKAMRIMIPVLSTSTIHSQEISFYFQKNNTQKNLKILFNTKCEYPQNVSSLNYNSKHNHFIFGLGFQACGTWSIHEYFLNNNIKSIHWNDASLRSCFLMNLKSNLPLLTLNPNCDFTALFQRITYENLTKYYRDLQESYFNDLFGDEINIDLIKKLISFQSSSKNDNITLDPGSEQTQTFKRKWSQVKKIYKTKIQSFTSEELEFTREPTPTNIPYFRDKQIITKKRRRKTRNMLENESFENILNEISSKYLENEREKNVLDLESVSCHIKKLLLNMSMPFTHYIDFAQVVTMGAYIDMVRTPPWYYYLSQEYPSSKYILNVRPVEKWLKSRIAMRCLRNERYCEFRNKFELRWREEWYDYICDFLNWFQVRNLEENEKVLVFDIENDSGDKFVSFFRREWLGIDYALNGSVWGHSNRHSHGQTSESHVSEVLTYESEIKVLQRVCGLLSQDSHR